MMARTATARSKRNIGGREGPEVESTWMVATVLEAPTPSVAVT